MERPNVKVLAVPEAGPRRSILLLDEQPIFVGCYLRKSQSAPARVKVMLAAPVAKDEKGKTVHLPLGEFRLEMN